MTIAEQIKAYYAHDTSALLDECYERGNATQDLDNETIEFDFADGSVLIVFGSDVTTYGSR